MSKTGQVQVLGLGGLFFLPKGMVFEMPSSEILLTKTI